MIAKLKWKTMMWGSVIITTSARGDIHAKCEDCGWRRVYPYTLSNAKQVSDADIFQHNLTRAANGCLPRRVST